MAVDLGRMCDDLALESAAWFALLDACADADWARPTPAPGWSVADQVSHLAHFDDMTVLGALDRAAFEHEREHQPVDGDRITERVAKANRGRAPADLLAWSHRARAALDATFRALDPSTRVPWFGPDLSAAAALTARIMETWAHGHDVADALGASWPVTPALRHVAHIGARSIPNAFRAHGRPVPEVPVRVELTGPDGDVWVWGPDDAIDVVTGPALDLCLLVTQRTHLADTALVARGPVAGEWLTIAQAFAGPPGAGRPPRT
jgi:hypothetical protein